MHNNSVNVLVNSCIIYFIIRLTRANVWESKYWSAYIQTLLLSQGPERVWLPMLNRSIKFTVCSIQKISQQNREDLHASTPEEKYFKVWYVSFARAAVTITPLSFTYINYIYSL